MTDAALQPNQPGEGQPRVPGFLAPVGRTWGRISPRLVPILAVITALIVTVPFMVITGGKGDIQRGLQIAGTAYSALIEGSLGLVINDIVSPDDFHQVFALAAALEANGDTLERGDLRRLGQGIALVNEIGVDQARRFGEVLALFPDDDDDSLTELGESIADLQAIGEETLTAMQPIISELSQLETRDVNNLAEGFADANNISPEALAQARELTPAAAEMAEIDFATYMSIVSEYGIVRLERLSARLTLLAERGISLDSQQALDLLSTAALNRGAADAREAAETIAYLDNAGMIDLSGLRDEIELLRAMYGVDLLTEDDVVTAINTELEAVLQNNLVVSRPGNRLIVAPGNDRVGIIYEASAAAVATGETDAVTAGEVGEQAATTDASEAQDIEGSNVAVPSVVYLRLGGSAGLFFPSNLEKMLVRSVPFIIAGLAVALAFKAGLFNIGAEGQLYIGGIFAISVAILPQFADLPLIIHLPLALIAGIIGGALWGAIPGALKAFTGAHEVITTIMLNYIAILLVDWLIKSTEPVILLDTTATTPRTAYVPDSAMIPRMNEIPPWVFIVVGILVLAWGIWQRRAQLADNWQVIIRPLALSLTIIFGGLFLWWITVGGILHIGFLIMIAVVWIVDWYLNRTTLGFELQTVGTNSDAARYSGMSVKRNIILAMVISGGLAGLAGTIEIMGVQLNMQPAFFSGLGFDAIAVALLARTAPRNMIAAGLLWGSLLAGAGLMQIRAEISIDLVRIIQALIIMFIAADAIIRWLWRIPKTTEKTATFMNKGWGS
jgi:simple sugar transport system permease protein